MARRRVKNTEIASMAHCLTEGRYNQIFLDATNKRSTPKETPQEYKSRGGRIKKYDSKGKFVGFK